MSAEISNVLLRLKNAINILDLRTDPNGMDLLPSITSVELCKMILLDAATALDHFTGDQP